ncbi:MAG TPA: hypothetical protein VHF47_10335 [Acidimicrobiales bacterium]|nr:hypothetical protein [Acidimicrobiales bacterium]
MQAGEEGPSGEGLTLVRGEHEGDELEIVDLEDALPPQSGPSAGFRVAGWAGRHRRGLLVAAVLCAAVGTTHALLVVRGVRALERQVRAAVVLRAQYDDFVAELRRRESTGYRLVGAAAHDTRVAAISRDYAERLGRLVDRAERVFAVEPGLRRVRRDTVALLRQELRSARLAGARWFSAQGVFSAAQGIDDDLRRRGLDPGGPPRPPPLSAPRQAVPLLDEPTGSRLFTSTHEGLLEVDIDTGVVRSIGADPFPIGQWAVADGFVGTTVLGEGLIVPFGSSGRGHSVGRYDEVVADTDDTGLVWFVTRPSDPGDTRPAVAHAFDRNGVRRDEVRPGAGTVAAISARRLLLTHYHGEGEGPSVDVVDRRSGNRIAALRPGAFFALRGDLMLWSDDTRLLARTLPGSADRVVPSPRAGFLPARVVVSGDGRRLAVVWVRTDVERVVRQAVVAVHDARSLGVLAEAWEGDLRVFPQAAWSGDGRWLFVLEQGGSASGRVLAWRDGLARPKAALIEGEFFDLAAF